MRYNYYRTIRGCSNCAIFLMSFSHWNVVDSRVRIRIKLHRMLGKTLIIGPWVKDINFSKNRNSPAFCFLAQSFVWYLARHFLVSTRFTVFVSRYNIIIFIPTTLEKCLTSGGFELWNEAMWPSLLGIFFYCYKIGFERVKTPRIECAISIHPKPLKDFQIID